MLAGSSEVFRRGAAGCDDDFCGTRRPENAHRDRGDRPSAVSTVAPGEEITRNLREAIEGWLSIETPEGELGRSGRVIDVAL